MKYLRSSRKAFGAERKLSGSLVVQKARWTKEAIETVSVKDLRGCQEMFDAKQK